MINWSIKVNKSFTVSCFKIDFIDFDVEESPICLYDYVHISSENDDYGMHCGNEYPSTIVTQGNKVTIRFVTDPATTAAGWRLLWNAQDIAQDVGECVA